MRGGARLVVVCAVAACLALVPAALGGGVDDLAHHTTTISGDASSLNLTLTGVVAAAGAGDVDHDGVNDLLLGVPSNGASGQVVVVFLGANGAPRDRVVLAQGTNGLDVGLHAKDAFGTSVRALGDTDGEGRVRVVVGAPGEDSLANGAGAAYVAALNTDGTVHNATRLTTVANGFTLGVMAGEQLGTSVAAVGDLDGNGVADVVVGTRVPATSKGRAYVLLLNPDLSVASAVRVADHEGGFEQSLQPGRAFGTVVAGIGDVDADGVADVAIGDPLFATDDGTVLGCVYVLLMRSNGTVRAHVRLTDGEGGVSGLAANTGFGSGIAAAGDLDGDGVPDLLVGAPLARDNAGTMYAVLLRASGDAKSLTVHNPAIGSAPAGFGFSLDTAGDVDGNGEADVVSGTLSTGAAFVAFTGPAPSATPTRTPTTSPTPSITPSSTPSPSSSASLTATVSVTPSSSLTPSNTASATGSRSVTASASASPSSSATVSTTSSGSRTPSITGSISATSSFSPSASPTKSVSLTAQPTTSSTTTPSPTASAGDDGNDNGLDGALVAGVVVGAAGGLVCLGGLLYIALGGGFSRNRDGRMRVAL